MSFDWVEEKDIETRVRALGLERAWTLCRDELISAARGAASLEAALSVIDTQAEPWPSMYVPSAVPWRDEEFLGRDT